MGLQKKCNQNEILPCVKCKRTFTRHMLMQVKSDTCSYKCIRCFNGGTILPIRNTKKDILG